MNLDASGCGLYGFRFASLLSNTVFNLHTASNGTYTGAKDGYFGAVNWGNPDIGYDFYVARFEATSEQLASTVPGTNGTVWQLVHLGPDPQWPIWQSGYTKYSAAGPYLYGAQNSPTGLFGLYAEADQLPSQLRHPAVVQPGSLDSGYVGNAVMLRSLFGSMWNRYGFTTYDGPTGIGVYVGDGPAGNNILSRTDPTYFPQQWNLRQRGVQLVEGFDTSDAGVFKVVQGPTTARPGQTSYKYLGAGNLPGPFADDAAAANAGVPLSEIYKSVDGTMRYRRT